MDLKKKFLNDLITEEQFSSAPSGDNWLVTNFILYRFHPDYLTTKSKDMGKDLLNLTNPDYTTTISQKAVRAIAIAYQSEMRNNGINTDELLTGKRGKKGSWRTVYDWLYEYRFPQWLWIYWQEKAALKSDWLRFAEIDNNRGMVFPSISNQIKVNKPLMMQIKLEFSEYYLLLLNSGKSQSGEETKYIVCPSLHFAPNPQPVIDLSYLPQPEAYLKDIRFDAVGQEEYIGILVKEIPKLSWLNPSTQGDLPIWEGQQIAELSEQLEKQGDYQIFYQKFEVV